MLKKKDTWNRIITSLESDIPKKELEIWLSQTSLKKLEKDSALIEVPNKFIARWLTDNYLTQIQSAFKSNTKLQPEIHFIYTRTLRDQNEISQGSSLFSLKPRFNPLWTFDNFITESNNRLAYSSALEIAKNTATYHDSLYIFSKLGSGKTHLLNAVGNYLLNKTPLIKIMYISADQIESDFSQAIKSQKLNSLREYFNNIDLLIIDNIHLISGHKKSQEELTSLLNIFQETKKKIVMAGKTPPSQISDLLPQLRSRLGWGLISEIKTPDQQTKMKIINIKTKEQKLQLPDDVIFFLANSTNDMKKLTKYMENIKTYISVYQRKITISTVKSIIKTKNISKISVRNIQKLTAQHFNISLSDLLSNKKSRDFSYPRQIAMYLSKKIIGLSYKNIGFDFSNKDHSTVIYAVKKIEKEKDREKKVLDDINKLHNLISG